MSKYKTIGIVGGQGPPSTADFYMRIVKYYQENFNTRHVGDFPPMIIFSVPTPDLVEGVQNEEETFNLIAEAIVKMEKDGCDFIVIVCNALQYLLERFQSLVKIPILGIAPIIAEYTKNKGYKTLGILAANTTVNKQVYDKPLKDKGIKLIKPNQTSQKKVENVILNEYSGTITPEDKTTLSDVAHELFKNGAEAILLACTELPLVIEQKNIDIPLIDCNEVYAQKTAHLSTSP